MVGRASYWRGSRICALAALNLIAPAARAVGPSADAQEAGPAPVDGAFRRSASQSDFASMARIERDLNWLADDARQGRLAGSEGYNAAAAYVSAEMARAGLRPGAQGGWSQPVPLRSVSPIPEAASLSATFGVGGPAWTLSYGADFLPGATALNKATCRGAAVFVGLGIVDPLGRWNDLKGGDLAGKSVVVLEGAPETFHHDEQALVSSRRSKTETLAQRGAQCVLFVRNADAAKARPWIRYVSTVRRPSTTWVDPVEPWRMTPTATLSRAAGARLIASVGGDDALLAAAAAPMAAGPVDLDISIDLSLANKVAPIESANVLGVVRGRDDNGSARPVVVTAHLDHVGERAPGFAMANRADSTDANQNPRRSTDTINNGAMDNALGVAIMLEVARAVASRPSPLNRDIIFAAVTAEESGLHGSDYLAARLAAASNCPVANINLDMPLTLFPIEDVAAFGADRSSLASFFEAAVLREGLRPGEGPALNLFARSDHFSFARRGVPSAFLFVGMAGAGRNAFEDFMKRHYHQPSDESDLPIDYASALKIANVARRLVEAVADADAPPAWNAGDYFGAMDRPCGEGAASSIQSPS